MVGRGKGGGGGGGCGADRAGERNTRCVLCVYTSHLASHPPTHPPTHPFHSEISWSLSLSSTPPTHKERERRTGESRGFLLLPLLLLLRVRCDLLLPTAPGTLLYRVHQPPTHLPTHPTQTDTKHSYTSFCFPGGLPTLPPTHPPTHLHTDLSWFVLLFSSSLPLSLIYSSHPPPPPPPPPLAASQQPLLKDRSATSDSAFGWVGGWVGGWV